MYGHIVSKSMVVIVGLLVIPLVFLFSGCAGSDGAAGIQGPAGAAGSNGTNGTSGTNGANAASSSNYTAAINSAVVSSASGSARATIKFTVVDAVGNEIVGLDSADSANASRTGHLRFNMTKLIPGVATQVGGTTPSTWWPLGSSEYTKSRLTNDGNGLYTYVTGTIPISGPTTTANYYDSTQLTRVVLMVMPKDQSGAGNFVSPNPIELGKSVKYDIQNGSSASQDVVPTERCLGCHSTFGDPRLNPLAFHADEGRTEMFGCVVCHYETRGTASGLGYGEAQIGNFVHKIHTSQVAGSHDFTTVRYPQEIRNCTTCHSGGADSDNWKNKPSVKACLSCHNPGNTEFSGMTPLTSATTTHTGGQVGTIGSGLTDDTQCDSCHTATLIEQKHRTDFATPNNPNVPAGVATFSYEISKATLSTTTPQFADVTFRIMQNGTVATLNTGGTGSVLPGFSGGPSFYLVYSMTQDGIANPSDWNVRAGGISLQNVYDGTKGTLSGPDGSGYYVAKLSDATMKVPVNAKMVTAVMSGSFTQGTTARPGLQSLKTADGYTARRVIFDPAKCNSCHEQLGTEPNFHSGSYNAAACAMCHQPNQSSNGWSASFRVWVHGIHGASNRSKPFTWQATSISENYSNLEYPGVLSNCEQCHLPGTYDFSASQYTDSVISNMLNVLVSKGTYTTVGGSGAGNAYKNSPYIVADGVTSYGTVNYSVNVGTGAVTEADNANLVSSPITAACSACHDSSSAISHMRLNGGYFYALRSTANANKNSESCLVCHGAGRISAIADVHKK